jgi:general secretion pathway protein I
MKRAGGFTLIEVLVALAIVAVALAAGLRAATSLSDNAARLSDVTLAQWCADNHLTELRLTGSFPGVGESDFPCAQAGRQFSGRLIARPAGFNPDFRQLQATVSDREGRILITLHALAWRMGNGS